ncbi:FHA domain-containing protein [Naumannella halotolerans]|uniref:Double zinc ribbon protein n=1 Tax=Naumannella halotolerans TaxID=993414 RepID=A0A4R7J8B1_9ACTN|nr:FHA domain-containing protein [Naumannella halotolerans]TDT33721.1 double zinc ribbon protein [Naumannella halotolerans]
MPTCPDGHHSSADDYCDVCGTPLNAPAAAPAAAAEPPAASPVRTCPHCGAESPQGALFCEACGYDFTTGTLPRPASVLDLDAPAPSAEVSQGPAPDPSPAAPPQPAAQESAAQDSAPQPASESAPGPLVPPGPATDAGSQATPPRSPNVSPAAPGQPWVAELWIDPDWYALQESPDPMPSPGLPRLVTLRNRSMLIGRPSRSRNIHPDLDCDPDAGISRRHAQLTTDGSRWWIEDLDSSNGTFVAGIAEPLPEEPLRPGQRREIGTDDRIYLGAWTRIVLRPALPGETG